MVNETVILWFSSTLVQDHGILLGRVIHSTLVKRLLAMPKIAPYRILRLRQDRDLEKSVKDRRSSTKLSKEIGYLHRQKGMVYRYIYIYNLLADSQFKHLPHTLTHIPIANLHTQT